MRKYCPSAGDCAPLAGSTPVAMLMPITPPIISAARIGAANAICITKPSASPTSTSPATASRPGAVSSGAGAAIGSHAQANAARALPTMKRICGGTLAAPNSGAANSAAAMRVSANSQRQNSASTGPKPKLMPIMCASSPDPRDLREHLLREIADEPHHRGTEQHEHQRGHRELGNERQRLLVHRRRRLDDHEHDRKARQQHRRRDQRGDPQHAIGQGKERGDVIHGANPDGSWLTKGHPKLDASEPISSAQPSINTNSSSLNGSETTIGLIIIMPRLISTEETTRS